MSRGDFHVCSQLRRLVFGVRRMRLPGHRMLPVAPTNDVGVLISILAMRYIPYHLHCRRLLIEVGSRHRRERDPTNQLFGWSSSGRSSGERLSILRFSII
jgi:hypothetical protein